ncbi:PROTEINASE INHIBITOR I4 SERPIN (DUF716)-RELATED [Salix koriyanagi]|uniref:PROTEINASE INHIBITOR I4 SERPIN (DUF716)-RELATED n=1 Tax=Salix koriyanagi TaxID=2511006 RepID=A0A9Q0PUD8_9ROSI|nr:PROTEINASE INHIBITOR I4 SERPIN (DUF716)-RELATED [Salix koriyanagi]
MGSFLGHVLPGIAFFILGLWHLFNHTKLYSLQSNSYISSPWFPATKLRYLELYLIMLGSSISISMELFIGPEKHQPFDVDGTIPSNHLRNFEHSLISMSFFVYATFAVLLDRISARAQRGLTHILGAAAFGQQLLMFHLHSTDHAGLEGQYHLLLQTVVVVSLTTTLMGIGLPKSFLVSFVRSLSILSQGAWFVIMGFMLWIPGLIPKGCLLYNDDGHKIVRCSSEEALHRAKSLANIQFGWLVIGITIFAVTLYLGLVEKHSKGGEYSSVLSKEFEETREESSDCESLGKNRVEDTKSLLVERGFTPFDMER